MSRPGRIVAAVGLALAIAAGGAYLALRASLPALDGTLVLAGLSAPVTVVRDARGVPTVTGRTRPDVARATGFVHARDRYFQMDLLRRLAAGELAALFGDAALDADRRLRLHGLRAVAGRALARLSADHAALLRAYADGVNAGLATLTLPPPEYLVLRTAPAPWAAEDSLLAVLAMFVRLSDPMARTDARRGALHECLPGPVAAFLAADDPEWAAPLDGGALTAPPMPSPATYDLRRLGDLDFGVGRGFAESVNADTEMPRGASNAWAVSGALTDDGRALLANDMHLGLAMPNTWYRMRLVVEDPRAPVDVSGVTLPGGPAVVAGSNGRVAWGFTNAYGDFSDRVILEPVAGDPQRYRTADGERRLAWRDERIEVAGGDPVALRVPLSVFGPVTEDARGRRVALRWSAHHAEAVNFDILALERVASVDEALDAATGFGIPPQNIVVGDAQGHVGWTVAGRIPRRRSGYDPTRPYPGSRPDAGWDGWLAAARHPRIADPPDGLVWTANHQVVTGDGLVLIGDNGYWHGSRARQIRDRLRALADRGTRTVDERDMLDLQLDDEALLLARWHALLTRVASSGRASAHTGAAGFRAALAAWSGHAAADDVGYRLAHAFRARVRDVVFAAVTAPCRARWPDWRFEGFRQQEGPLWRLLRERPAHLLHPGHASWDALLDAVAVETMDHFAGLGGRIAEHGWGEHNRAHARHPLSHAIPALGALLDAGPDPAPGDRHMPRVTAHGISASERFAVRPGRERDGILHMPGGSSGHFLSPGYRAGHADWRLGRATPFLPGAPSHRMVLTPDQ